jgi:hypothetical protein
MLRDMHLVVILTLAAVGAQAAGTVQILLEAPDAPALQHALHALTAALQGRGLALVKTATAPAAQTRLVAGLAGKSRTVDALVQQHGLTVPAPPESLLIHRLPGDSPTILLAGRDERGLLYALLEAAEAVRLAPQGGEHFATLCTGAESPALPLRSISVALQNADLERAWYFDEDHWRRYFAMLARDRFNTFLLRFADQTNYQAPLYPWLFDLPDYPEVKVAGLSATEQARNLAMLKRIGVLATEHGLDFGLAIWQQQPVVSPGVPAAPYAHNYGPSAVNGLPAGAPLADYATKALARLLQECPTIRHLQLRLNYESGIPEAIQRDYYRALNQVLQHHAPLLRLEMRYKGLSQDTVDQAVAAGLPVTVSTKFWCEHLGLPFHPTTQDPLYSASRYGYGTLLKRPRNYQIAYQLWNQGSNRLFVWGDPAYAARFIESCVLGDGVGFEVFAPLSNRGWGNEPGAWRLLARPELESTTWDFERYWHFYGLFGRLGYNPKTPARVWEREFAARFGAAGPAVARAYQAASQVLPLLTASGMPSASEWSYWTEMDLCGSLDLYSVLPPSDHGQFYGIRAWKALPGWSYGAWSTAPKGFVEDALAGDVEAKWTPVQVSRELDRLAEETLAALETARQPSAEFRMTEVDLRALAYLARYHAAKKRAATHLAFFYATQEAGRLEKVLEEAEAAATAWQALVAVTDGVYAPNLVFGRSRETVGTPEKPVNAHAGHWKDRLPNVLADVAFARTLLAKHPGAGRPFRIFPGETPPATLPRITHTPVTASRPDAAILLVAQVDSPLPLRKVLARFRTMDQTKAWTTLPMQDMGNGRYQATISSKQFDASCDLLYYLEARVEGGGTLWPNWQEQTPYVKVRIGR